MKWAGNKEYHNISHYGDAEQWKVSMLCGAAESHFCYFGK
jgi:hypothetical protein